MQASTIQGRRRVVTEPPCDMHGTWGISLRDVVCQEHGV